MPKHRAIAINTPKNFFFIVSPPLRALIRFFLKCRFGLHGLEALFRLLDGHSDDARRHGVQVELQNGRADPRRCSGGTL